MTNGASGALASMAVAKPVGTRPMQINVSRSPCEIQFAGSYLGIAKYRNSTARRQNPGFP